MMQTNEKAGQTKQVTVTIRLEELSTRITALSEMVELLRERITPILKASGTEPCAHPIVRGDGECALSLHLVETIKSIDDIADVVEDCHKRLALN